MPSSAQARRIAITSAWAVGSLPAVTRFVALGDHLAVAHHHRPDGPPRPLRAFSVASSMARRMNLSSTTSPTMPEGSAAVPAEALYRSAFAPPRPVAPVRKRGRRTCGYEENVGTRLPMPKTGPTSAILDQRSATRHADRAAPERLPPARPGAGDGRAAGDRAQRADPAPGSGVRSPAQPAEHAAAPGDHLYARGADRHLLGGRVERRGLKVFLDTHAAIFLWEGRQEIWPRFARAPRAGGAADLATRAPGDGAAAGGRQAGGRPRAPARRPGQRDGRRRTGGSAAGGSRTGPAPRLDARPVRPADRRHRAAPPFAAHHPRPG